MVDEKDPPKPLEASRRLISVGLSSRSSVRQSIDVPLPVSPAHPHDYALVNPFGESLGGSPVRVERQQLTPELGESPIVVEIPSSNSHFSDIEVPALYPQGSPWRTTDVKNPPVLARADHLETKLVNLRDIVKNNDDEGIPLTRSFEYNWEDGIHDSSDPDEATDYVTPLSRQSGKELRRKESDGLSSRPPSRSFTNELKRETFKSKRQVIREASIRNLSRQTSESTKDSGEKDKLKKLRQILSDREHSSSVLLRRKTSSAESTLKGRKRSNLIQTQNELSGAGPGNLYRQLSGLTIDDDLGEAKPNLDVGCSSLGNIPEDIQVSGNSTTEKNESLKLAIESKAWGIHADDESVMSSEYHERYQSVYLVAEIEALEDLLDEEERQLEDLQDEVDRCKKKNCELTNDCRAKRRRINRLEEEYGELKVVLAESRANEDNLELQLSRLVMERDLQVLNLTNDYNQLYCALRQAQRENEQYRKATAKVNRKFERQSRGFRDSAHGYEASWGLF